MRSRRPGDRPQLRPGPAAPTPAAQAVVSGWVPGSGEGRAGLVGSPTPAGSYSEGQEEVGVWAAVGGSDARCLHWRSPRHRRGGLASAGPPCPSGPETHSRRPSPLGGPGAGVAPPAPPGQSGGPACAGGVATPAAVRAAAGGVPGTPVTPSTPSSCALASSCLSSWSWFPHPLRRPCHGKARRGAGTGSRWVGARPEAGR